MPKAAVPWLQELSSIINRDGLAYRRHGRVVKGVRHRDHDEAMEAGGGEFKPRPGHYIVVSF